MNKKSLTDIIDEYKGNVQRKYNTQYDMYVPVIKTSNQDLNFANANDNVESKKLLSSWNI